MVTCFHMCMQEGLDMRLCLTLKLHDPTDQGGSVYDRTSELGITSFSCSIFTACTLSSSNKWEERSHEDVLYTPAYQGRLPGLETFDGSLNLQ